MAVFSEGLRNCFEAHMHAHTFSHTHRHTQAYAPAASGS